MSPPFPSFPTYIAPVKNELNDIVKTNLMSFEGLILARLIYTQ